MADSIPVELTRAVATFWNLLPRWLKTATRRLPTRATAASPSQRKAPYKETARELAAYASDSQALAEACELICKHAAAVGIDAQALLKLIRQGDLGQLDNALQVMRNLEANAASQAGDDTAAYVPASQLLDGRRPTLKAIRSTLHKNPSIRWRRPLGKNGKPIINRLEIHAGDWERFTRTP